MKRRKSLAFSSLLAKSSSSHLFSGCGCDIAEVLLCYCIFTPLPPTAPHTFRPVKQMKGFERKLLYSSFFSLLTFERELLIFTYSFFCTFVSNAIIIRKKGSSVTLCREEESQKLKQCNLSVPWSAGESAFMKHFWQRFY